MRANLMLCNTVLSQGIYFLFDGDELVYIGETENVFKRIGEHIHDNWKVFDSFAIYPTEYPPYRDGRKYLESFLIKIFQPRYNRKPGKRLYLDIDAPEDITITEAIQWFDEVFEANKKRWGLTGHLFVI